MDTRTLFCKKCNKDSLHNIVDDSVYRDMPKVARIILAICSFGISEYLNSSTGSKKFICCKCGEENKKK